MCNSENHQGYLLARRRPPRSLYSGNGWCSALPWNLCIHHLLRLGDHPCAQHWFRFLDERADCRGSSACSRASPGRIWRRCKFALRSGLLISWLTPVADHLLPRRYSLGSGVRWVRWNPRLQALCYRCLDPRSRMAHHLPPG